MRTKLLFAAAVMTVAGAFTQSVYADEEDVAVAPVPLKIYDFNSEHEDIELKLQSSAAWNIEPTYTNMLETKVIRFTDGWGDDGSAAWANIPNPLKDNTKIATDGATISLWFFRENDKVGGLWDFNDGADQVLLLGVERLSYNILDGGDRWFDAWLDRNADIPVGKTTMVTVTFTTDAYYIYINGNVHSSSANVGEARMSALLDFLKNTEVMRLGYHRWSATSNGAVDNLCFFEKALTASEVAALYEEQNENWTDISAVSVSKDHPVDVTYMLDNASCVERFRGWIKHSSNESNGDWLVKNDKLNSDLYSGLGVEYYNARTVAKDINLIEQTVTGLKPGSYKVMAYAIGRVNIDDANIQGTGLELFANGDVAKVETTVWGEVSTDCVVGADGKLTLGLHATSENNTIWSAIANVRLMYCGNALEDLQNAYNAKLAERQALGDSLDGQIATACVTALKADGITFSDDATESEYYEAIAEIEALIKTAKSMVRPYADFMDAKKTLEEKLNNEGFNTFKDKVVVPDVYRTAIGKATIDELTSTVNNLTTGDVVTVINRQTEKLNKAYGDFIANVTDLIEGVDAVDMTFLIQQADFEGVNTAWSRTVEALGNLGFMNPNFNDLGRNIRFIESYVDIRQVAANAERKLVYQTLSSMPVGCYTFEATSFNRRAWFDAVEEPNAIIMYLNESGTEVNSTVFSETLTSIEAISKDGVVEFGLKSAEDFNTDWNGLADVHLYYTGACLELNEDDKNDDVVGGSPYCRSVAVTRTLNADKWNTFCVPFDMTAEEMSANHITEVRMLTAAEANGDCMTLTFTPQESIEAGVPYIVKTDGAVSELTVKEKTLSAQAGTRVAGDVTMFGNYGLMQLEANDYFIQNNMFYYVDPEETRNVMLKGFRAYIRLAAQAPMVNRMMIDIDGSTTSVEELLGETVADADKTVDVYTLSGIRVKKDVKKSEALNGLPNGVYVVDGKKVVK